MLLNGFKNIAAISLETDIKVKQLGAISSGAPAPAPTKAVGKEAPKAEAKKEEKVEEKEEVALGDMFGDWGGC